MKTVLDSQVSVIYVLGDMHRIIALILLSSSTLLGQATGSLKSVNKICAVDGLKYKSVQSAVSECGGTGIVVIPPTFASAESFESHNDIFDAHRPENLRRLTPVTEFGAKGDAATGNDGASESGSATFSAASASFVTGRDEGKVIIITGAGADNGSLTTTIKTVNGPSHVTLAMPAGFTARELTYWFGTDDTSAFETAYKSRKPLYLPPGKFLMTGTVKGDMPLFLVGAGPQSVIIDDTAVFDVHGTGGHFLDNFRMQSATKLTPLPPNAFPTPHAATPIALDRSAARIGYQPQSGDGDVWPKVSTQQRAQRIGPTLTMSSDGIHIYRITGDLISIILFDVQDSEVALCDFRAGRNFVGGIALWHTPNDGRANKNDSIHDNVVRYASFSGIVWTASEHVSIRHNQVGFNGESGLKNYSSQSDGTYNTFAEVIGNHSEHNHYDGLDLSEDYPHSNSRRASSTASENTSVFNDNTGTYVDGSEWTLTNNIFEDNGLSGISADVSDSVISGNTLSRNNTSHHPGGHQIIMGPGTPSKNNMIERNRIMGDAASGSAITWSGVSTGNKIRDNTATGGATFKFGAPPAESHGNSDSHGRFPDR